MRRFVGDIRLSIKQNDSRNVWKRINEQKRKINQGKQKTMEMGNKQGEIESARQGILKIKTEHIQEEFYRTPEQPRIITIPAEAWGLNENEAEQHIRPDLIRKRENAQLTKYMKEEDLKVYQGIMMTRPINTEEINTAINLLADKKSVGRDSITAEVIKEDEKWLTPILDIVMRNCQKQTRCPKAF